MSTKTLTATKRRFVAASVYYLNSYRYPYQDYQRQILNYSVSANFRMLLESYGFFFLTYSASELLVFT